LRRTSRRLLERAHDRAARKLDLEAVMGEAFGALQKDSGGIAKRLSAGLLTFETTFGVWHAPRLMSDAPNATRASLIAPPSILRPAATETKANA
jgi:hypothetical protein